jgi:hypothetical protein
VNARRVGLLVAGLVLLGLAVLLAVAAEDARTWPDRLREGDVRYRAVPSAGDPWPESRRTVRTLLGVNDDLRYRRALWAYRVSEQRVRAAQQEFGGAELRAQVETLLGGLAASDTDPVRRSSAATILGVLAYGEYVRSSRGGSVFLQRSLRSFREAIQLDPSNDDAKFDLELLLELVASSRGETGGTAGGPGGPETDVGGAGITRPGEGY